MLSSLETRKQKLRNVTTITLLTGCRVRVQINQLWKTDMESNLTPTLQEDSQAMLIISEIFPTSSKQLLRSPRKFIIPLETEYIT